MFAVLKCIAAMKTFALPFILIAIALVASGCGSDPIRSSQQAEADFFGASFEVELGNWALVSVNGESLPEREGPITFLKDLNAISEGACGAFAAWQNESFQIELGSSSCHVDFPSSFLEALYVLENGVHQVIGSQTLLVTLEGNEYSFIYIGD